MISIDTSCDISGVHFKNPVVMASGTFGFGMEYGQLYDISMLGGICGKGLTLNPKEGNDGLRVYETPSGMMNSVGLENPGISAFLEHECPRWEKMNLARIVNLGGGTIDEYVDGAILLGDYARRSMSGGHQVMDMIELNISCPNVKAGGMAYGVKTEVAREVVSQVRRVTSLPLIVKLSPNAENITEMAIMCQEEGADAISLINTFSAMKIDIYKRASVFKGAYAGLSGPAIKPIALRMVHQVAKAVTIPVMGMGGISSVEDMIEFIMAGASVVQIGTYNFVNLQGGKALVEGLEQFMIDQGIHSLDEIRGIL